MDSGGLSQKDIQSIHRVFAQFDEVKEVVLYGSEPKETTGQIVISPWWVKI